MDVSSLQTDPAVYVVETAGLLGLKLAREHLPGVVANLTQLQAIALPLLEFPVTGHDEIAPVFVP